MTDRGGTCKPVDGTQASGSGALANQAGKPSERHGRCGRDRRVGHVLRLALVAHRCSDGGNSNLAVATIKALHLRLGLRWDFRLAALGPLVERKDAFWAKGPARSQIDTKNRGNRKLWDVRRPSAAITLACRCERRLNPRGLFQLNYIRRRRA